MTASCRFLRNSRSVSSSCHWPAIVMAGVAVSVLVIVRERFVVVEG